MADTVQKSEQPFRLLDLPPELWVRIGKFAVDNQSSNYVDWGSMHWSRKPYGRKTLPNGLRQPAITRACHLLRKELLPYFYGRMTDPELSMRYYGDAKFAWLEKIGAENRRCLRGFRLVTPVDGGRERLSHGVWHLPRLVQYIKSNWRFALDVGRSKRVRPVDLFTGRVHPTSEFDTLEWDLVLL